MLMNPETQQKRFKYVQEMLPEITVEPRLYYNKTMSLIGYYGKD